MSTFSNDSESGPRPEDLVAYVDGQLDDGTRWHVERWLAAHPDAHVVVEDHRQVLRTLHEASIPEPTAEAWDAAFARVEAALPTSVGRQPVDRDVPRRRRVFAAVAAAALFLAIPSDLALRLASVVPLAPEAIPFPVAAADEVEIVSIDAADLKALLVGQPPLRGALELAAGGDVQLNYTDSIEHSWVPAMGEQQGVTPIFMVPMRTGSGEKP